MKNTLEAMKELTFGIEIELTGLSRRKAAKVVGETLNGSVSYYGGSYDRWDIKAPDGRVWIVEFDSSISPQKSKKNHDDVNFSSGHYSDYKVEFVSPICNYDDIETIQKAIRALREAGAIANSSTGIHIHIGADGFTPQTLRNLVNNMASKEDILYRALQVKVARENYCKKVEKDLVEDINREKPKTMADLKKIWYKKYTDNINGHYNSSRYHGLNLHATYTKGTVEFRLFNSTTHAGELKAYIQFCMALAVQAQNQKRALSRKSSSDNEKYMFRCWLLRLGLIGDEFKTGRLHMLKNLEGNAAWRAGHAPEKPEAPAAIADNNENRAA